MKEKTILHSDANNFFASVETALNPNLKDKAVAVTGNPQKRTGIILAKNERAKSFGVKTGEAIWEAKQKCPDLVVTPPHYDIYEEISKKLHEIYLDYTDLVEPLGLDECWLDVTPSLKYLKKTGTEIANEIRKRAKEELGITVSVGVSFSKLFAKLGSDMKKPDATTIIARDDIETKIYPLPLNTIVGVGRQYTKKLEKMNIKTIQDFVNLKENFVKDLMGKNGTDLQQKLKGQFDEKVASYYDLAPPKSIGNGTTTIVDIISRDEVEKLVSFLSEKIAQRMANGNYNGACISVSLKTNDFKRFHHSRTISPIKTNEEITEQTMSLIDSFWNYDQYLRAIRITISTLDKIDKTEQLSFFNTQDQLSCTIKNLKNKYGSDKIFIASDTASFINRKNKNEDRPENQ